MRCRKHCPPGRASLLARIGRIAAAVFVVLALAVHWLAGEWPLVLAVLAAVAALAAAVAVGVVKVSRWSARLAVVCWRPPAVEREAIKRTVIHAELAAPPKEIAAPVRVLESVIISNEEAVR